MHIQIFPDEEFVEFCFYSEQKNCQILNEIFTEERRWCQSQTVVDM
jgi:hypothetical protein